MKDYVNSKKPSQFKIWWRKHGDDVKFLAFVTCIAIIGSVVA
ncbi:MAG: hypothetical protein ACRCXB_28580 [Aeromonadaceae bacterium]